jgi:hypothetical protein
MMGPNQRYIGFMFFKHVVLTTCCFNCFKGHSDSKHLLQTIVIMEQNSNVCQVARPNPGSEPQGILQLSQQGW